MLRVAVHALTLTLLPPPPTKVRLRGRGERERDLVCRTSVLHSSPSPPRGEGRGEGIRRVRAKLPMTDTTKLAATFRRKERMQGAGLDLALPYLLLAPAVLIVLCVLVYPLWDGLKASAMFYRYGKPMAFVGFDNYIQLWRDPQFLNALWVTVRFVFFSVAFETVLGLALALFCLREFYGIRLLRTILIIPMVVTPVVVAIVFRLIYASDARHADRLLGSHGRRPGADPGRSPEGVSSAWWRWTSGSGRPSCS